MRKYFTEYHNDNFTEPSINVIVYHLHLSIIYFSFLPEKAMISAWSCRRKQDVLYVEPSFLTWPYRKVCTTILDLIWGFLEPEEWAGPNIFLIWWIRPI